MSLKKYYIPPSKNYLLVEFFYDFLLGYFQLFNST